MLRKLLKYDLAAVFRVWWVQLIILPALSLSTGILIRLLNMIPDGSALFLLTVVFFLAFYLLYFVYIGSVILTEVLVFARFYKNFYTDEGYLTFTLPVKRSTLFLSKTLNAMIWNGASTLLTVVSILLILPFIPENSPNSLVASLHVTFSEGIRQSISSIWSSLGGWTLVYAAILSLLFVLALFFTVSLMHFCITVGSILVKRGRLFLSIGIYYGVNSAISSVITIGSMVFGSLIASAFSYFSEELSAFRLHTSISLCLLVACAFTAALGLIFYSVTLSNIERRLNLP